MLWPSCVLVLYHTRVTSYVNALRRACNQRSHLIALGLDTKRSAAMAETGDGARYSLRQVLT